MRAQGRERNARPHPLPLPRGEGGGSASIGSLWRSPVGQLCFTSAFTLIEVLLAVAIASVVLTAIGSLFFGAMQLRARTAEVTEANLPLDHVLAVMKRDFANIVPPGTLAGPMASETTAVGLSQPVALEIFSASGRLSDEFPWGDIQRIDYSLNEPTNRSLATGKDLVRNVTRNLLATIPEPPEQQLLISDVEKLQFSYCDGTNWVETWSSTQSNTPSAIKVLITFTTPKSGRHANYPLQFLVPVATEARTNQTAATN